MIIEWYAELLIGFEKRILKNMVLLKLTRISLERKFARVCAPIITILAYKTCILSQIFLGASQSKDE